MFSAYDPYIDISGGNYVTFSAFFVNIGDTFDLSTGTFTAPVKGIYEFSFSGTTDRNSEFGIGVYKNGTKIHAFYSRNEPSDKSKSNYDTISSTWLTLLDVDDTVKLKVDFGKTFTNVNMQRVFNGKLLKSL